LVYIQFTPPEGGSSEILKINASPFSLKIMRPLSHVPFLTFFLTADALKEGKEVKVDIQLIYNTPSKQPEAFEV
jgi:hypothetical protein